LHSGALVEVTDVIIFSHLELKIINSDLELKVHSMHTTLMSTECCIGLCFSKKGTKRVKEQIKEVRGTCKELVEATFKR